MACRIASVVEGHGETEAVPILIRKLIATVNPPLAVDVVRPIRVTRSKLLKPGELERPCNWRLWTRARVEPFW